MQHTKECIQHKKESAARIEAWTKKWPNHCRHCGGWGGLHDPGVYRYPDVSGEPPSFDECECIDEERCPRCGMDWTMTFHESFDYRLSIFLNEYGFPCPCCGWSWGQNHDDGIETQYPDGGCGCFYNEWE